jgi:hypothetical protein
MTNVPDPIDSFSEGLARLTAFALREHDTIVPHNHQEGYFELGQWVEDIRELGLDLGDERRAQLLAVDGWTWDIEERRVRGDSGADFDARLGELDEFVQLHGHARVPQMVGRKTSDLGIWVKKMRDRHNKRQLSNSQIRQILAFPGWEWDAQYAGFLDNVDLFRNAHGRAPANSKLGRWVAAQRKKTQEGKQPAKRRKILAELSDW